MKLILVITLLLLWCSLALKYSCLPEDEEQDPLDELSDWAILFVILIGALIIAFG